MWRLLATRDGAGRAMRISGKDIRGRVSLVRRSGDDPRGIL